MKFNCYYRAKDGSRQVIELDAIDRNKAFCQAKQMELNVIEMFSFKDQHKSAIRNSCENKVKCKKDKIPNEDELKLLQIRINAYWLGFWCAIFSPLTLGLTWLIALIIAFCKYEKRGVLCCLTGLLTPELIILMALILPIIGIIPGIMLSIYFYKQDILLGFTMPTNINKL